MNTKEAIVVRAYVNHTGTSKFSGEKFSGFLADFPMLLEDFSKDQLKKAIATYGEAFVEDIDPTIKVAEIKGFISPGKEMDIFFGSLPNLRLSTVVSHFKQFKFADASNKRQIGRALLTIYGANPTDPMADMNAALNKDVDMLGPAGPGGEPPVEPAPTPDSVGDMDEDPMSAGTNLNPVDEMNGPIGENAGALPPDVEETALHTMDKFLIHDVFNNRIIPKVSVTNAWKVQNGFVVTLEFASTDGEKKAYTQAVIHNDRLILPAELTSDAEGKTKVGDFDKDTLLNYFAEQAGSDLPTKSDNYNNMMDQMMTAPTPIAASKVMDRIIQRFGSTVGKQAFDTYTRVKHKKSPEAVKLSAASKLEVVLSGMLNTAAHPEIMDGERDDALRAIKNKLARKADMFRDDHAEHQSSVNFVEEETEAEWNSMYPGSTLKINESYADMGDSDYMEVNYTLTLPNSPAQNKKISVSPNVDSSRLGEEIYANLSQSEQMTLDTIQHQNNTAVPKPQIGNPNQGGAL